MRIHGQPGERSLLFSLASILLIVCGCATVPPGPRWYRGNTHAHTTKSDGSATPRDAAAWYRRLGYQFLCITDHNQLTLPGDASSSGRIEEPDFIVIPSEEITQILVHASAINIKTFVPTCRSYDIVEVLGRNREETERASGILIVNHPMYADALHADDLVAAAGIRLFELYNCGPGQRNEGDATHMSTEALWDAVLSSGKAFYGVASDDTTVYSEAAPASSKGPGRGWIMVWADTLSPDSICSAMQAGRFYASIGVLLSALECGVSRIVVAIDKNATERELAKGMVQGRPAGRGSQAGERIDFIGTGGRLLRSVEGSSAEYVPHEKGYVRARAVVTRDVDGALREYCAWAQPVFVP